MLFLKETRSWREWKNGICTEKMSLFLMCFIQVETTHSMTQVPSSRLCSSHRSHQVSAKRVDWTCRYALCIYRTWVNMVARVQVSLYSLLHSEYSLESSGTRRWLLNSFSIASSSQPHCKSRFLRFLFLWVEKNNKGHIHLFSNISGKHTLTTHTN